MEAARCERLGLLLEQALALPSDKRRRFIEDACGDDTDLIGELSSLVAASEGSSGYFEELGQKIVHPAIAAAAAAEGDVDDAPDAHRARRPGADVAAPGEVVSHYEIIERVGGGMGVVYRARDLRLGRTVALKFLPPALAAAEAASKRLYAEARAASSLDHPNIGVVYEIGETDRGSLFIVLRLVRGRHAEGEVAARPTAGGGGGRCGAPGRGGAGCGARSRYRPPRRQALEHHLRRTGHCEAGRLRDRQDRRPHRGGLLRLERCEVPGSDPERRSCKPPAAI